jgi:methyltransferase (TIGR00027 family)
MSPGDLSLVGATALGAAMMRAQETARNDALIHDPYASAFVAAARRPFEHIPDPDGRLAQLEDVFRADVALRTRFIDDYVDAAANRGVRQFVLLAAGLDTRAYRLAWPERSRLYELDIPEVLDFKDAVLRDVGAVTRCQRFALHADLRENWPAVLEQSGFQREERTAWVAEGLLAYLPPDALGRLFDAIDVLSDSESELAFEVPSTSDDSVLAQASDLPSMESVASMWHGDVVANTQQWLDEHNWTAVVHDRNVLSRRYKRDFNQTKANFVIATLTGSRS